MPTIKGLKIVSEESGNKEVTFKKNVDYFELKEGTVYTIDALQKKYNIGRSTVYNKARDGNLELVKIGNFPCFLDDPNVFSKKERVYPASHAKHLKPMTSYGELVNMVKDIQRDIKACTIPDDNTSNRLATIEALLLNTVEHQKANNKLLNEILNHLTKGEK